MSCPTTSRSAVRHAPLFRTPAALIRARPRQPASPAGTASSAPVRFSPPSGRGTGRTLGRTWAALGGRARAALLGVALMGGLALPAGNARALDVNRADASQLQTLRGIGPSMAQRILTERDRNGPFVSLEALRERVRGIGEKKLQSLREAGLSASAEQGAPASAPTAAPPGAAGPATSRGAATPAAASSSAAARGGKEGASPAPVGRGRPQAGAASR